MSNIFHKTLDFFSFFAQDKLTMFFATEGSPLADLLAACLQFVSLLSTELLTCSPIIQNNPRGFLFCSS